MAGPTATPTPPPQGAPDPWDELIKTVGNNASATPTKTPTPPKSAVSGKGISTISEKIVYFRAYPELREEFIKEFGAADYNYIMGLPPSKTQQEQIAEETRTKATFPPSNATDRFMGVMDQIGWRDGQQAGGASAGASSGSSFPAAASGGSGGSSASSTSSAAPKAPLPNSRTDLVNRGANMLGSTPVLEGQQYRKVNEVVEAADGQWYIVDPAGSPVGGPYPNQTQANAANVYSNLGPAVTSNDSAAIGQAALDGPMRRRVAQGSGQNQATSLDNIIGLSYQSGQQPGEFMGSTGAFGRPVDVLRGNVGIPDYGGMRQVPGGGFTGRMLGDDGQEVTIGQGGVQQEGTAYGSHTQMMFAPYLTASQIGRLNPEQIDALSLRLGTLRDQGLLQDATAMGYTSSGGPTANTAAANANYSLLTGEDPYNLDILPTPMATGGSVMPGFGRETNMMRKPMGPRGFGMAPQPVTAPGTVDSTPPIPQSYLDRGGYMDENRPMQIMGKNLFSGAYPMADLIGGKWNFRGGPITWQQMMAMRQAMPWGGQNMGEERQPQGQDIWRGLMDDSDSWYTGPAPDGSEWRPRPMGMGGSVMTRPDPYASGGSMVPPEPVRVQGMNTGTNYAVAGAQPELMTVGNGGVGFEPLGGPMQQQQGMMQEQQMAQALGPVSPPPRPLFAQPVMVNPNRRGRPFRMEDPLMTLSKMRGVA